MTIKERYEKFVHYFSLHHAGAATELDYNNPYQLLVAVILSAQCTDKRVNLVTPSLFMRYPNAAKLAEADEAEVFSYIRSISYPNNKTKHLIGMANKLHHEYNDLVPSDVATLMQLPGVGRKTANVIASVVYHQPAMAVDTHVFRVAARIGLTRGAKTPRQAEDQLTKNLSEAIIPLAHHWLILHGRYVCKARKPMCHQCEIGSFCKSFKKLSLLA